ncbi:MAG: hypothetical protein KME13_18595 [Myxacorys californica WJT36-NPBG1]|jgi:hypothetical protein|nr:hypothetical protein [Myxacorys californica WJT36-NPBG1]
MSKLTFEQKRTLLRMMIIAPEIVDTTFIVGIYLWIAISLIPSLLLLMLL